MSEKLKVGTVRVVITPIETPTSVLYRVDVLLYRKRKPLRSKLVDRYETALKLQNALAVSYGTGRYLCEGRTRSALPKRSKPLPPREPLPMKRRDWSADDAAADLLSLTAQLRSA